MSINIVSRINFLKLLILYYGMRPYDTLCTVIALCRICNLSSLGKGRTVDERKWDRLLKLHKIESDRIIKGEEVDSDYGRWDQLGIL